MDSLKRRARMAGLLYLILAITSIIGLVYVPSKIIIKNDFSTTVTNIKNFEMLFRMGILSNLIYLIVFVFLVLSFYNLFKEVDKKLSIIMVTLVIVAIPIAFVNQTIQAAVLNIINNENFIKTFNTKQVVSIIQLFLNLYEHGNYAVMIFWGLWLFPLGLLIIKSKFIPKIFGILLIFGCFGYLVPSFTYIISPYYGKFIFPISTIPSAVAEILIILWLLIKGIKDQN